MLIKMISLSLKRARVFTILCLVLSIVLLSNMAGVPFTESVVHASNSISSDINGDGVVDVVDLCAVCIALGSNRGQTNWNSGADLNDDDRVDLLDLQLLMKDYGADICVNYFALYGQGDFELFPFSQGARRYGYDWDWVNGQQVSAGGTPTSSIYIKQSTVHVQQGTYSAEFHIGVSSGAQHCKLFEINQNRYPESYWSNPQPEAYYSAWYWFPADFADTLVMDGWSNRLIMQWADRDGGRSNFPTVALLFEGRQSSGYPLRLVNDNWWRDGSPEETKWETGYNAHNIPKGQWVHVVVYVKMASGYRVVDGKAIVWINDEKVVDADVALWNYFSPNNKGVCWGIGNYGTAGSPSSIWIDNVQVTG